MAVQTRIWSTARRRTSTRRGSLDAPRSPDTTTTVVTGRALVKPGQPRVGDPVSNAGSAYGRSCAAATGALVSAPPSVLSPWARTGSAATAPRTPRPATFTRYGNVADVRASVEVRATAPGMLATQ